MKLEKPPSSKAFDFDMLKLSMKEEYQEFLQTVDSRYLYWDEMRHRKDLPFDQEKSWKLIKANRLKNYKNITIGKFSFKYYPTYQIQKDLHEFDLKMIGGLYENPITHYEKAEYLKNSLMEEAIASSQIEGAATTTKIAWDMLETGRKPRNESEQMIFNNLRAIRYIEESQNKNIDTGFIIELHKIMTVQTTAEECAGDYRKEEIFVQDRVDGEIEHIPPGWKELESLMESLCDFANSDKEFIHPIIKASTIHFLIGYIHPFKDGNGRTARALFYWYLSKKGYSLIKNISISRAILESRIQYDKAFLKTEYDQNDLNYFITYSIKSLRVAFESLVRYRDKKKADKEKASIIAYRLIEKGMSTRQSDLLGYLYSKEGSSVSLQQYAKKNDIVRQTARRDLSELVKREVLVEEKKGKAIVFRVKSKSNVEKIFGNSH
jgi:Fic family protein